MAIVYDEESGEWIDDEALPGGPGSTLPGQSHDPGESQYDPNGDTTRSWTVNAVPPGSAPGSIPPGNKPLPGGGSYDPDRTDPNPAFDPPEMLPGGLDPTFPDIGGSTPSTYSPYSGVGGPPSSGGGGGGASAASGNIDQFIAKLLQNRSPGTNQLGTKISETILARLAQAGNLPGFNDPAIKAQLDAYNAQQERQLRQGQGRLAERAYAQGLPAGFYDAQLAGSTREAAESAGEYGAQLVGAQIEQQRDEILSLLQLGAGLMTGQEEMELRALLAQLNAELAREGLAQSSMQFYDDLGFRSGSHEADLNQRYLEFLAGGDS